MRDEDIQAALDGPCLADNTVLVNFAHAGAAALLRELAGNPIQLSPTILDPAEAQAPATIWLAQEPNSEFLRQLHRAQVEERDHTGQAPTSSLLHYRRIAPRIEAFAQAHGTLWQAVDVTPGELKLASYLASREVRQPFRERCPDLKGRVELDAGEAEAAAVAIKRERTLLVDDQAAVRLLRCLYPGVPVLRTCELLVYAVKRGLIACTEAANLFNRVMVDELGFYARRPGERLWLRCEPQGCSWEQE